MAEGSYPSLYYEEPPILLIPPFQILSTPPPPFLLQRTLTPTAHSVVLFLWLNGWSCQFWCAILLKDIMDVHMSNLRALICVLCNKVTSLLKSDKWCGFLLVLWFDIIRTHTRRHTSHEDTHHTQGPVDWHTHINIYLYQLL